MRYRIWLPVAHTLIDCVLLAAYVWWGYTLLQNEKRAAFGRLGTVTWDTAHLYSPPPPRFQLILSGTAPAAMVSMTLRPNAAYDNRLWDPVWFCIHEAVAIAFWFFIGFWFDSGHRTLVRTMSIYLCARGVFAALSVGLGIATPGAALQGLFWYGLFIYALIRGFGWMIRRAGELRSPGTGREARPH